MLEKIAEGYKKASQNKEIKLKDSLIKYTLELVGETFYQYFHPRKSIKKI